jgi:hypothetical protein
MPAWGIDWLAPVRSFRNFFGTYGTTQGSIRGVLNAIVPVAIVDRYRDDDEGSLFGMTCTAAVPSNKYAAFSFGSVADDWELYAMNFGASWSNVPGNWSLHTLMIYTPDSTYQPVQHFAPAGIWVPGMNTDWSFTLGSVTGITGYNDTLPARFGTMPFKSDTKGSTSPIYATVRFQNPEVVFDPPIRVYRDVSLSVVNVEAVSKQVDVTVSLRYRIRPRTTDGPRTGN